MATYAIGDVHGCYETLRALLVRSGFSPGRDRLWMVGDLVNRGPRSLEVLRWAADMGDRLVVVLGNHDLYLLARGAGVAERKRRDTLDVVLAAADGPELLAWLRRRPLLHREGDRVLVHAGLFPEWSAERAEQLARETEERLRGGSGGRLLRWSVTKRPDRWR
jgi:bis(5'-nucleosyl)-tetraphosphatase (symmetrical)